MNSTTIESLIQQNTDALYAFSGAGWTWCGFLATIGGGLFFNLSNIQKINFRRKENEMQQIQV